MSDLKNIDELFKKGAEKHYPVDENLWAEASSQLDAVYPVRKSKKGWLYISLALLLSISVIYGITSFLTKNEIKNESVSSSIAQESTNAMSRDIDPQPTHAIREPITTNTTPINPNKGQINQPATIQTPVPMYEKSIKQGQLDRQSETVEEANSDAIPLVESTTTNMQNPSNSAQSNNPLGEELPNPLTDEEVTQPTYTTLPNVTLTPISAVKVIDLKQEVSATTKTQTKTNPRLPNWFIALNAGFVQVANPQLNSVVENGLWSRHKNGYAFGVNGGYKLGRLSFSTGFGQTTFRSTYEAKLAPKPRIDTISSYYALITNEYQHFEKTVSLIERRYITESYLDSNAKTETVSGVSRISYVTIPIQVGYTFPFNRFEVTTQLSTTFMVRPTFTHSAPANFASVMKQNEQAIRPSLVRPALHIGIGYRLNTNISLHAEIEGATSSQSLLSVDQQNTNTIGLKLGIMTRF